MLRKLLAHPLTRGLDVDDPGTTELRRRIIKCKPFLRRIYEEWYRLLADAVPPGDEPILELGAGGGFLSEFMPNLLTSEVFPCPGVSLVLDGRRLPFANASLRAVVMTNVLHHIPQVEMFLHEAARCVRPGGVVAMVEPWVSRWSRLVYSRLHHEPFDPGQRGWHFATSGPLSGANGALPWILFHRDADLFCRRFRQWKVEAVRPFMPLRYLLSGGVSMRSLAPGWSFPIVRSVENLMGWRDAPAMFAYIALRRIP
jgi:SAM-dependent methyltransferase